MPIQSTPLNIAHSQTRELVRLIVSLFEVCECEGVSETEEQFC